MIDPIVEEVRRVRVRLLEECGDDLQVLAARHRELAAAGGGRRVSLEEFRQRHGRQPKLVRRQPQDSP